MLKKWLEYCTSITTTWGKSKADDRLLLRLGTQGRKMRSPNPYQKELVIQKFAGGTNFFGAKTKIGNKTRGTGNARESTVKRTSWVTRRQVLVSKGFRGVHVQRSVKLFPSAFHLHCSIHYSELFVHPFPSGTRFCCIVNPLVNSSAVRENGN